MMNEAKQQIAEILWERLVKEFNDEAETYNLEAYESLLGSIGPVEDREVMRSKWCNLWTAICLTWIMTRSRG